MKHPKPTRDADDAYLEFLRGQTCCVYACADPGEPHHLKTRGSGGPDYAAVPMCRRHHTEIHFIGRNAFEAKHYKMDLAQANADYLAAFLRHMRERFQW